MCDTLLFHQNNTKFFLKNSDRSPNEVNIPVYYPRCKHEEKILHCTYIDIPQVEETYGVFLIKPSWIWGAEMGINEYGVTIGNEAVFTKNNNNNKPSLIGMDFLRLALERSTTAYEAIQVIIDLLSKYSQGGNCGYDHEFYYDNSYLITDKKETYVLETIGKNYAYKKVETYNISNVLSFSDNYDQSNLELCNLTKTYTNNLITTFSKARCRMQDGINLLNTLNIPTTKDMIKILSHHHKKNTIKSGDVGSICMHKNMIGDHTTGSMIVDYNHDGPIIWMGGSTPCLSVFKPYLFGINHNILNNEITSYEYAFKQALTVKCVLGKAIDYQEYKNKVDTINNELLTQASQITNDEELINLCNIAFEKEKALIDSYEEITTKVLYGEIKLKGIWNSLIKHTSKYPFSRDLNERLKH